MSVNPLEAGQSRIRGDLGVRVGRMVGRQTQMEASQLYLSHLEHWDPLVGKGEREGGGGDGRKKAGSPMII